MTVWVTNLALACLYPFPLPLLPVFRDPPSPALCNGSDSGSAQQHALPPTTPALIPPFPSSPPPARPWDVDRDGFVMGEGSGVLVLESLEHAEKRGANIIAEFLGGAVTCDAYHMTDPRADGLGVSSCIELAIKDARIDREAVNYINAHATR